MNTILSYPKIPNFQSHFPQFTQIYFIFQTTQLELEDPDDFSPDETENEIDVDTEGKDDLYYDKEECTMQEYEIMKDNLLLYNHARLISQDNHSKDYLVSIMFSHYDQNNNGNLEAEELSEVNKFIIK